MLHFIVKHEAEHAANQDGDEQDEHDYEVAEQQELQLLLGPKEPDYAGHNADEGHCGEYVDGASEQIGAQQLIGKALFDNYPQADGEDDQAADLEWEIIIPVKCMRRKF